MSAYQERNMTNINSAIEWNKNETKQKPLKIKESEVNRLMTVSPKELTPEHPITTPLGTWTMDGPEVFFHPISEEKLREIIIPDFNERKRKFFKRTKELIIKYGALG